MKYADQVVVFVGTLAPDQRKAVKRELRLLAAGRPKDAKALNEPLEGFYRLRVGKFRLIYRYDQTGEIAVEFIEVRRLVYERFVPIREMLP